MGEQGFNREAQPIINQQPLETEISQTIIKEIAADNHLALKILPRDDWENKDNIFRRATLYLPNDLHIWEIPGVVEAMGYPQIKERLQDLGRVFQNTGVYLARRLHTIDEGNKIAKTRAEELYDFGESLILQKKSNKPKAIEDISKKILTVQETREIDSFWISTELYRSSQNAALAEIQNNPDKPIFLIYEEQRIKILNQIFKASQEAFEYQYLHRFGFTKPTDQPSETPPHITFIQEAIKRKIEEPLTELTNAIVQYGTSQSTTELPPTLTEIQEMVQQIFLKYGNIKADDLYHLLQIDRFQIQIESLKQNGDTKTAGRKERDLARHIQNATYMVAYQEKKDAQKSKSPGEISVKATNIGIDLMQKAGLNPLVVSTSGYSTILLVTSDHKIKRMDMTTLTDNSSITSKMLQGVTLSSITAFNRNPQPSGLRLTLNHDDLLSRLLPKKQRTEDITVYSPEQGQKISSLFNTAISYYEQATNNKSLESTEKTGLFQKSFILFEKILESSPQDDNLWYNYGIAAISYLNTNSGDRPRAELLQKAQDAFTQAITLNPENHQAYFQLGNIFEKNLQKGKAAEAYKKALELGNKEARRKKNYIRQYTSPQTA